MGEELTMLELIQQYSADNLDWETQGTGISSTNGAPTAGTSGIDASNVQFAKILIAPQNNASVGFRLWIEYEALSQFFVIDGSDRSSINRGWTQEIDVSGAARLYVEITSISQDSVDLYIALGRSE
jgi:F420-0:gamma-glutamyl ligase